MIYKGGCFCGSVQFEVHAPKVIECKHCNCSFCSMTGYLHLIVPKSDFKLIQGEKKLTSYSFDTARAEHKFCKTCGAKSFYVSNSSTEEYDVNVNFLKPIPNKLNIKEQVC